MGAMVSQITSLTIAYSTVHSDAYQRKYPSSESLAFVWGIHRGPVNSLHKWPVTRKKFPFHDAIMEQVTSFEAVIGTKIFCCSFYQITIWRSITVNFTNKSEYVS